MGCKIEKRCLTLPRIENKIINEGYYHSKPQNVTNSYRQPINLFFYFKIYNHEKLPLSHLVALALCISFIFNGGG